MVVSNNKIFLKWVGSTTNYRQEFCGPAVCFFLIGVPPFLGKVLGRKMFQVEFLPV